MNRSERTIMCVVVFTCLGLISAAPAKIIYVDDDAPNGSSSNGSSWASAFVYLQQALSVAGAGDEIRVAQGTYRPDQGLPATLPRSRVHPAPALGSPYAVFQLKNGVTLRGGFAGLGTEDPEARDPQRYPTILSGDLHGDDIDLWGPGNPLYEFLRADNSLNVVQSLKTDATAVLDGFVIESTVDSGLFNQEGSPTIANCVFQKCSTARRGGGLRCEKGRPMLSDCRFLGNWADQEGGAICSVDGDLSLTRCAFETNWAREGGAIHQTAGTLTLVECTFETNAANDGGAVAFAVEAASMTRCVFRRNQAISTGGALENGESPLTLDRCVFSGNTAGLGGALYTIRLWSPLLPSQATMAVTRCLFTGNRAWSAGGALSSGGIDFTILGCTFAGNQAPVAATFGWWPVRAGEVIYRVRVENCIVWDGMEVLIMPSAASRPPSRTSQDKPPEVLVRYCDVQAPWPGEGNFTADPCFAAPGRWVDGTNAKVVVDPSSASAVWVDGDYHLKSQAGRWDPASEDWVQDEVTSLCIDAGDPNSPVGDEPEPNGGRVNMGAYGGTAEASRSYVEKP